MSGHVRVVLADDHDLLRDGVAAVLDAAPDLEVVAEASSGPSAVAAARAHAPDVVLMDIEMPGGDGIAATREILATCPGTRVLVLTMFDLDDYVLAALRAGASGFLLKTTPAAALTEAVRACAAGDTRLSPTVLRRLVDSYVRRPVVPEAGAQHPRLAGLTARELEVLRALGQGRSNAEIAAELFMAETTVKTHVTRILAKLGLRDRVQAAIAAVETGLVLLGDR